MDELKAGIDTGRGHLDAGTAVEVVNTELGPVVIHERAHVRQADDRHLAVTDLNEDGRLLGLCGPRDRQQRFLVLDVEGSHGEVFLAGAAHQVAGRLDAGAHVPLLPCSVARNEFLDCVVLLAFVTCA
jgi:hypothetical protein